MQHSVVKIKTVDGWNRGDMLIAPSRGLKSYRTWKKNQYNKRVSRYNKNIIRKEYE